MLLHCQGRRFITAYIGAHFLSPHLYPLPPRAAYLLTYLPTNHLQPTKEPERPTVRTVWSLPAPAQQEKQKHTQKETHLQLHRPNTHAAPKPKPKAARERERTEEPQTVNRARLRLLCPALLQNIAAACARHRTKPPHTHTPTRRRRAQTRKDRRAIRLTPSRTHCACRYIAAT